MKKLAFILAVLPLIFSSCENQFSEKITARLHFGLYQNGTGAILTSKSSLAEGILIDSAVLNLQNISLLTQNSNGQITSSGNTVFAGPYRINLITHSSSPDITSVSITPGTYFGINALLYVPQNTGYSIYISGTYTMNDKWWKFYYTNSGSLTFQVTDSTGFTVDQYNPDIWVVIDVVSFFKKVDFSKAVVDNDNVIRINGSSNTALAVAVQSNFTVAASVSNNQPDSKDENSTSGQPGGSSNGSSNSGDQGNNSSTGNSGSANNSGSTGSASPGSVSNSGSSSQNKDQDKNKEKEKEKDKQKDKEKNGTKSKHDQKDNNKKKDKDKDKNKDKDGH